MSLCCAFFFWCYNGCLISFLVSDKSLPPFNDIEDLINHPDIKLLLGEAGYLMRQIQTKASANSSLASVIETNIKPYSLNLSDIEAELDEKFFNAPIKSKIATVISNHMVSPFFGNICSIIFFGLCYSASFSEI